MQTINLNVTAGALSPVVHVSQCDYMEKIIFNLFDGDELYEIPSDAIVGIYGTKPDKCVFGYVSNNDPYITFSGSTVTVYTSEQMTACAGITVCELKITTDDETRYTLNFNLDVEASALPQNSELSKTDIPIIIKAVEAGEQIADLDEKLKEASAVVSKAEEIVAETKASAESASNSATSASTSETNAQNSANSASASAETASTSATSAQESATSASASATSASSSADSALASANAAKASEESVAANATAAQTAETNAKASADEASASQTAAKNSQTQAAGSATKASNSAKSAEASATSASTSETNASNSATAAAQSAQEASSSAETSDKWAKYSESYAHGSTETRTGEDTDNAKYYSDVSKNYAAQAKAAVTGVSFTIVDSLPSTGLDGVFYLIAHEHGGGDSYDEYAWISDAKKFEKIGSTDVDLTDYVKVTDTATTATNGVMSASDKAKLDSIATGATKVTIDDALAESGNPVANKAVKAAIDDINTSLDTKASASDQTALAGRVTTAESNISANETNIETIQSDLTALTKSVGGKADKATTLEGYGITDGASSSDLTALTKRVAANESGKADKATTLSGYGITDAYTKTETDTALSTKADSTTVETLQTEGKFTVSASGWSSTTVTVNGGTYYTYTLSCADVAMEHPIIGISGATDIPTADEQTAYDCLSYAVADTTANTITLYAETAPTVSFYVIVKGAK